MKTQVTLWIEDKTLKKIIETAVSLQTNRQGAIKHILEMYYQKQYSKSSAQEMQ